MNEINFTNSRGTNLTITDNKVRVVDAFGDTYTARFNERGKLTAKSSLALAVCMRALNEYKTSLI